MGLTAHNKQRREMAAQGLTGAVVKAQAQFDAALKRAEELANALELAERHLEGMATNLEAAEKTVFEALPKLVQKKLKADAVKLVKAEKAEAKKANAAATANAESQAKAAEKRVDKKAKAGKADKAGKGK